MSRAGSVTAPAPASPEGTNGDSENLSNWGSIDGAAVPIATATSGVARARAQRRQTSGGGGGTNTARRASVSSGARNGSRRLSGGGGSVAFGAGTRASAEREAAVWQSSSAKANGMRPQPPARARQPAPTPASGRGRRGGSLERPTASSSQERPSAVGAATRRTKKRLSVEKPHGTNKPRSLSVCSAGGKRISVGGGETRDDDDEEEDAALAGIAELDAAAPSQEEIRLMIDRIRREAAVDEAAVAVGRVQAGPKGQQLFEHEVRFCAYSGLSVQFESGEVGAQGGLRRKLLSQQQLTRCRRAAVAPRIICLFAQDRPKLLVCRWSFGGIP